jgi:hypothetical protein
MLLVRNPIAQFWTLDGEPLDNGSVYIGAPGVNPQTNPVNTYWDKDGLIPAPQPVSVSRGYVTRNGSPARLFIDDLDYSILVVDSRGVNVYSALSVTGETIAALGGPTGAASIGYDNTTSSLAATDVQDAIDEVVQSLTGVSGKVSKTGDTMTGPLEVPSGATGTQVPQAQEVVARTSGVGSARLPNGTTAQRDASPANGMTRLNTTFGLLEYYSAGQWRQDGIIRASSQNLNTTTGVDFTGVPSTQKRIDLVFEECSLSGSDNIIVQVTTNTTGLVSTGYEGGSCVQTGGGNTVISNTSGFVIQLANSSRVFSGVMSIYSNTETNKVSSTHQGNYGGNTQINGSSAIDIPSGEHVTEIRVTRSGSNTFDSGRVYLQWN